MRIPRCRICGEETEFVCNGMGPDGDFELHKCKKCGTVIKIDK